MKRYLHLKWERIYRYASTCIENICPSNSLAHFSSYVENWFDAWTFSRIATTRTQKDSNHLIALEEDQIFTHKSYQSFLDFVSSYSTRSTSPSHPSIHKITSRMNLQTNCNTACAVRYEASSSRHEGIHQYSGLPVFRQPMPGLAENQVHQGEPAGRADALPTPFDNMSFGNSVRHPMNSQQRSEFVLGILEQVFQVLEDWSQQATNYDKKMWWGKGLSGGGCKFWKIDPLIPRVFFRLQTKGWWT